MNRGKSRKIAAVILSGTLLMILAFALIHGESRKIKSEGEKPMVLSFALPDLKGEMVDISQFRGKVVLLNFWATWCPPCRQEIPDFNELYRQYNKDGLVVVGVSMDHGDPKEVREFLEKKGVEYLNLRGDKTQAGSFGKYPGLGLIQALPTTFLIDRQGDLHRRFIGFTEKKIFEKAIKQLL